MKHAINRNETLREALSSESLGTTHCRHYISLHYIHQALPQKPTTEAKTHRLSLSLPQRENRHKTDFLS